MRRFPPAGYLLRAAGAAVALTTLYYVLPLDRWHGPGAVVGLLLGLLLCVPLVAWQVARITRAEYPRLCALEAVATAVPLIQVLFSAGYFLLSREHPPAFTEALDRTDALYFTVATFATVGYGDIAPVTTGARVATTAQIVVDLMAVGLIVKVVAGAAQIGLRRRHPPAPPREENRP